MSVRRTDRPSWKIHVCSRNKWTLLENYKKVAPGKKEQIFSKTVSVAASVFSQQLLDRVNFDGLCTYQKVVKLKTSHLSAFF